MKDKRPVNLDIGTMRLPITAWASITHRATGVFIFAGVAVLLWILDESLASPESFASLKSAFSSLWCKLLVWSVMAGLIYHSVAGVKHLIADFGFAESMAGGILATRIVIAVSAVLILLAGAWIW
ncbi:MAG: succinate dehydrogenase / fumarate reductase cytochrome b subunit [Halioglobus sp.]